MIHIEAQIPSKISGTVLAEKCTIEFAYEVSAAVRLFRGLSLKRSRA
jgi:hypothetical protein